MTVGQGHRAICDEQVVELGRFVGQGMLPQHRISVYALVNEMRQRQVRESNRKGCRLESRLGVGGVHETVGCGVHVVLVAGLFQGVE